jgi:dihydrofolate synthase/folylpolyglutamate synthase
MQSVESGGSWILDVAHNSASAQALAATLRSSPVSGKTIAIIAMLDDKDVEGVISPLMEVVDRWIAVTARNSRAIPAVELAREIANQSNSACLVAASFDEAIDFARQQATADDRILATGSFYVVGPVLDSLTLYSRR